MSYILFDAAIAVILLIFLWRGHSKGFVLTLCGFLALFVAFLGASFLADLLSPAVAKAIVPAVENSIHQSLEEAIQHTEYISSSGGVASLPEELPLAGVLDALQDSALYKGLADTFQSAVDKGVAEVTTNAARALAEFMALKIARTVIFLLAFAAILAGWWLLSHALDLAFKLPVLSTLNQWAGAAVGLLKGALFLFIAAWLLKDSLIPTQAIEHTFLLKFFCTASPLSLLSWI